MRKPKSKLKTQSKPAPSKDEHLSDGSVSDVMEDEIGKYMKERKKKQKNNKQKPTKPLVQEDESDSDADDALGLDLPDDSSEDEYIEVVNSESENEIEPDEELGTTSFGNRRSDLYNAEIDSDDDVAREEELEAKRIQKKIREQIGDDDFDFGFGGSIQSELSKTEDSKPSKKDKESESKKKSKKPKKGDKASADSDFKQQLAAIDLVEDVDLDMTDGQVGFERIEKDLTGLTDSDKLSRLTSEAPELFQLLQTFKDGVMELQSNVLQPSLQRLREGKSNNVLLLDELKFHLLSTYCTNVAYYLYLKSKGQSVKDHEVFDHLLELKSQLDHANKLSDKFKAAEKAEAKSKEAAAKKAAEKLAKAEKKAQKSKESSKKKGKRGARGDDDDDDEGELELDAEEIEFMKMLTQGGKKVKGLSVGKGGMDAAMGTAGKKRKRHNAMDGLLDADDFGDVEDMMHVAAGSDDDDMNANKRKKLRDTLSLIDSGQSKRAVVSGDMDLPQQNVRRGAPKHMNKHMMDTEDHFGGGEDADTLKNKMLKTKGLKGEDDFYKAAAMDAERKKKSKNAEADESTGMPVKRYDRDEAKGRRQAGRQIMSNRGLTPSRSKESKNPRLKHRKQFDKATTKRRTMRRGASASGSQGNYLGETTGIKGKTTRSVKLG